MKENTAHVSTRFVNYLLTGKIEYWYLLQLSTICVFKNISNNNVIIKHNSWIEIYNLKLFTTNKGNEKFIRTDTNKHYPENRIILKTLLSP